MRKTKPGRWRSGNAVFVTVALGIIAVQAFRFIQVGPKLAAVAAETTSPPTTPVTELAFTFGDGELDDYQRVMQHTEQVVETLRETPTTRPTQLQSLKVNPFKVSRLPSLLVGHTEQERADTFSAAQAMTLQSIMHSDLAPVCLINNVLLREQQQLNGFTVDRIRSDSVVMHRGPYRFELRLVAGR